MVSNQDHVNPFAAKIEEIKGVEHLEHLQEHENIKIYKRAKKILDTYFPNEEMGDQPQGISETGQYGWVPTPGAPADYTGF